MTQKPGQGVVRENVLARVLHGLREDVDREMAVKSAALLMTFHEKYVQPLEDRIKWLETPWYLKLAAWAVHQWRGLTARWRPEAGEAEAADEGGAGTDPEPEPAAREDDPE